MKLAIDTLASIVAGTITYFLVAPYFTETGGTPSRQPPAPAFQHTAPHRGSTAPPLGRFDAAPALGRLDPAPASSIEEQASMNVLRNELIRATARDMHQRHEDVMNCLTGIQFAGVEKLRFSVAVVSMPDEATAGPWRFVEVADGEPLPESFAACVARAFGGLQHLRAPKDFHFPRYEGELLLLYTIPPKGD